MTKNTWTLSLLAVAVAAGPVLGGGMTAGMGSDISSVRSLPPGDSAVSLIPTGLIKETPASIPSIPAEASISILPAVAPQSAAKADVQAMLAPQEAVVPAGQDVSKMSGDQASGAGEAIMDRILYIKGTPAASSAVEPVAVSQGTPSSQLQPARRSPLYYLLAGPAKIATKSTEYISQKTHLSPFWTALGMSFLNVVGAMKSMTDKHWDLPMNGMHMTGGEFVAFGAFMLMALMYLGHSSWWMKQDAENDALKKMDAAVAKAQESLKTVPGVASVKGETIPGKNANDHVIVVQVKQLDAANINKIPKTIDGLKVQVQFAR